MNSRRGDQQPKAERPKIPPSYGIEAGSAGMLDWGEVSARLEGARNYWISTTSANGAPKATPVWGLWIDGAFYFFTDRASRKARNLRVRPGVGVHLESGDDVVILEGVATTVTEKGLLARLAEAYNAKYGVRPETVGTTSIVFEVRPRKALAWREKDFTKSATRWRFEE